MAVGLESSATTRWPLRPASTLNRLHGRRVESQPDSHRPLRSRQLASVQGVPAVDTVSSSVLPGCQGLKCLPPVCRSPYDPDPRAVVPAPPPHRLALPRARVPDRVEPGTGVRRLHRGRRVREHRDQGSGRELWWLCRTRGERLPGSGRSYIERGCTVPLHRPRGAGVTRAATGAVALGRNPRWPVDRSAA